MTKHGMQNPQHFKAVCLRLLQNEIIDWQRFDPKHPDTTAVPVVGPIVVPPPVRRRQMRRPRGAGLAALLTT